MQDKYPGMLLLISILLIFVSITYIFQGSFTLPEQVDIVGVATLQVDSCDQDFKPRQPCGCSEGKWLSYQRCSDGTIACVQC